MPQRAQVTAIDALESFRASLIVYVNQARSTLEEVSADVVRTRNWLEHDQRTYWDNQMRRRARALDEARQALFSAKLSNLRVESSAEQMAVHRARRALDEGEAKLRVLKRWDRDFDNRVQPLVKQMEKLHSVLAWDMSKASAYLAEAINTLSAYVEIAPPQSAQATEEGVPSGTGTGEQASGGQKR